MFTVYTPGRANKILPDIARRFNIILSQRNCVVALQEDLQRTIESGSSLRIFTVKKQELNNSITRLYKAIEELENLGVIIKSVDDGLLDFPSMRFDEEVWLCWKAGETEIKFWHGKDEGFMGRKPLIQGGFPSYDNREFSDLR
jgi:hypothetical protein